MTIRASLGGFVARLQRRAALGIRPLPAPVVVFIPLGTLLGPEVLNILPRTALGHLDVVVTFALALLGVFIGLAAAREGRRTATLFAASTMEGGITILIVGLAVFVLLSAWEVPLPLSYPIVAAALGLCASASAAAVSGTKGPGYVAARVADLDDVLPIVLGGALLVVAAPGSRQPLVGVLLTVALGLAIGFSGWLLIERAEGSAERGVFVLGSLGLLGGAATYLHFSPLLTGMAAGWLWVVAPGHCDQLMSGHLRKAQHPLVVLVLITAGASLEPTLAGIWLFAPYLVFRLAGKLIGGWTASCLTAGVAPSDLGAYLIPPGVIGIAFALNLQQVTGAAGAVVFAVALGALASELIAIFVTHPPQPA